MKETKLVGIIKTIGEDMKEYDVHVYQDFSSFQPMGSKHKIWSEGIKRPLLSNGAYISSVLNAPSSLLPSRNIT